MSKAVSGYFYAFLQLQRDARFAAELRAARVGLMPADVERDRRVGVDAFARIVNGLEPVARHANVDRFFLARIQLDRGEPAELEDRRGVAAVLHRRVDLRDLAPGLSLAGGVTWQDKVYLNYAAASSSYADRSTLVASRIAEAPQNFQIDAAATYRFDRYRVALNVYNLTDELNYAQVFANRAAPAAGRTFILSFGATF